VALAVVSLVPIWFGAGILYGLCAAIGGGYFVWKSILLHRDPSKANAMGNFFASLLQLALLVAGALLSSVAGLLP
jgi:protoheme IX farnesyltransferase